MEPSRQYICAYKLSLVCASCTSESVAQDPKSFRTPRMCKPCYNLKASKAYNSSTRRTSRLSRNTQPTLVSFRPSLLVETQLLKQVNKSLIFAIKKKDDKIKEITAQLSAAQADQAAAAAQTQAAAQAAAQQLERVGLRSETEHSACESVLGQDDLDEVYAEEQEERLTATEAYAQSLRSIGSCLYQNKRLMLSLKNSMCDLQRESQMRRLCSCTCKFHDLESELSTAYDDERAAE